MFLLGSHPNHQVYDPYPPLANSAPGDGADFTDRVSIGSATDDEDDFDSLKKKRDEERLSRYVRNVCGCWLGQ